jgi:hypothetical protein
VEAVARIVFLGNGFLAIFGLPPARIGFQNTLDGVELDAARHERVPSTVWWVNPGVSDILS